MCVDIPKLNEYLSWVNTETYEPIPTRLEEALYDEAKADYFHVGNEIIGRMQADLLYIDTAWKTRSRVQKKIHHKILSTIAPFVYKSSYKSHHKQILEYNNFTNAKTGVFMKLPRRGGKTEAAAQICAIMMKHIPNHIISIIAPAGRQVKGKGSIKQLIREIVENVFHLKIEHTDECITYTPNPGDVRKIFALPGGSADTYVFTSFLQVSPVDFLCFPGVYSLFSPLLVDSTIFFTRAAPILTFVGNEMR